MGAGGRKTTPLLSRLCYNFIMVTKHFFKTLIMFSGIIILGLIGVFIVSYYDEEGNTTDASGETQVAR